MNGVTRYVLRQLVWGMILVSSGLTCILWLTQSLRLVDMIVNRGLSPGRFFYLTMLLLPNFITIILPIALFTVVVFTYNKLITDRELMVMQVSGLSPAAIAKPALILALIVATLGYALNFEILPASYRKFRELQWDIRYNYSHVLLQEGAFNSIVAGITVYVRARSADGQLLGILVHDARDQEKPFTMMAERGALMESDQGARVVMFNGNRQQVDKNANQLSILYFDRYVFEMNPGATPEGVRFREARERTVGELFNIDEDPTVEAKDRGKFKVEGHRRLLSPLWSLAFALVGLVSLLSGGFSRHAQSGRIITAVAVMVSLQGLSLSAENLAARNLDVIPVLYVLVLTTIGVGFALLARPVRFARIHAAATPS